MTLHHKLSITIIPLERPGIPFFHPGTEKSIPNVFSTSGMDCNIIAAF